MFPWQSRPARRSGLDGRRRARAALECLEGRELLAFSPLGMSLPDLTVTGFASPAASWGGPLTVTVNVRNLGASSIVEPLATFQGSASSADAPVSTVSIIAEPRPHDFKDAVTLGYVVIPALGQNSEIEQTSTITLPNRPWGFPGDGGRIYIAFVANATGNVFESDTTNNVSQPVPVLIQAPLPDLAVVGLDVPPVIQPGDTIQPNIRIANIGPADTLPQGPVQVSLVASTTPTFNFRSRILATYTVANIPGTSHVASIGPVFGDTNLVPPPNDETLAGAPVTRPASTGVYYIGVVVDPLNRLRELSKLPRFSRRVANPFRLAHRVGPPIVGLPPAGFLVAGGAANVPTCPIPFGNLPVGGSLSGQNFPVAFPPVGPLFGNTLTFPAAIPTTTPTLPLTGSPFNITARVSGLPQRRAARYLV